jgi:hypothetical protein
VDPVREAEQILRSYNRRRRLLFVGVLVLVFGSLIAATVLIRVPLPARGTRRAAVLVGAEASYCAEGVTHVAGGSWASSSESLDRFHLPLRGHLEVLGAASAIFSARHLRIRLEPAMPCTAG